MHSGIQIKYNAPEWESKNNELRKHTALFLETRMKNPLYMDLCPDPPARKKKEEKRKDEREKERREMKDERCEMWMKEKREREMDERERDG